MKNRYIQNSSRCRSEQACSGNLLQKFSFLHFLLGELTKVLQKKMVMVFVLYFLVFLSGVRAWTGEIHGRVICDVCGDSSIGPEDHILEGAEVAVLCITKSGEVLNYQAFTDSKGTYTVAETMPQSDRWDVCLARPISSFHQHCTSHHRDAKAGVKFSYNHPSGYSHTVRPFLYQPAKVPTYCI